MTAVRLRLAGLVVALCVALMLAVVSIWAASAQSKPTPEDHTANIQLLGVNDFHGNLEPPATRVGGRPVGGAAYLDTYLNEYEAKNPGRTIRVHAGDMVGASPLISSYFHDEPTVYAMNNMEFDVGTLGNHEFDEGGEEMLRLINGGQRDDGLQFKEGPDGQAINTSDPNFPGADFPYIAANTILKSSGQTVLPPAQVVERDGVRVGFIGVTTEDTPNIVVPDAMEPFRITDISETVNRQARQLQDRGVKAIVVLAHAGGQYKSPTEATGEIIDETAEMNRFVDVVVAGHSHSFLNNRVNGKLIIEAFSFGTAFDQVNMKVDRRTGEVIESSGEVVTTYNDEAAGVAPDPETAALVASYDEQITTIENRVVGNAATTITRNADADGESALGDLIADAQREYADAQIAFMNPGGIRADIQAGEVTYGELFTVQPFDNQVVKMELTGDQIYRLLEQQFRADGTSRILQISGIKVSYNASNPLGQRITSVTLTDGTLIDRNDTQTTYTVAANSFIATGGDGFAVFKEASATQETLGSDLDALEAYVGNQESFGIPADFGQRLTRQG